jgi:histidine ammonia-lyase
VGEALPVEVVRAATLLRANALAKGASGIRPVVVETLLAMLNKQVHPFVPSQGSVGASGDLAPLSHLALVLSRPPDGEPDPAELSGEAIDAQGRRTWGKIAMAAAGIERLVLGAKEGLALNNGVQISAAIAALALLDAERLAGVADLACAMTIEAVRGVVDAFLPEVHVLRPFVGQAYSAANVLRHLHGSSLAGADAARVQDGYSLRCAPQVHGAARDSLRRVREALEIEINSATDNPLIFAAGGKPSVSAGQFHGEPIAMACDALKVALAELAAISERRVFRLLTKALSFGLPPLLAPPERPGLGLMTVQFTAAGLAAENKHIAHPSSVDSLPTCEDQEDHVSMSPIAARGARRAAENTAYVIAAELLCAAYALALRQRQGDAAFGDGTRAALAICERAVALHEEDATPGECLEEINARLRAGEFDALLEGAGR